MELVYLWVEDYKNIHRQGFNFSPKFNCHYDGETLTIKDNVDEKGKKQYIENFFGDNINVTAIVGKNGSGKSSVLESCLLHFFAQLVSNGTDEKDFAILYNNEKNAFYKSSYTEFNIKCDLTLEMLPRKTFFNIHYNSSTELMSSYFTNHIFKELQKYDGSIYEYDYKPEELNVFSFPSKKDKVINILKNENMSIINMFRCKDIENNRIIEESFKNHQRLYFKPIKVTFNIDSSELEYQMKTSNVKESLKDIQELSLDNLYIYYVLSVYSSLNIDSIDDLQKDYLLEDYFFKNNLFKNFLKNILEKKENMEEENKRHIDKNKVIQSIKKNIAKLIEDTKNINIENTIGDGMRKLNVDTYYTALLIDVIKKMDNNLLIEEVKDNKYIEKILPNLPSYIIPEAIDKNGISFDKFSSGEKYLITFAYSIIFYIYYYSKYHNFKLINLFIDEIELSFHPKWQTSMIQFLINITKSFKDIKFNIYINSHSPFLLSDIPKQNIIFLDTYNKEDTEVKEEKQKVGNCRVVPHDEVMNKKQTFGANIHMLLSDSFFMEDGLMGEFAKGKINKIIRFLNGKNKFIDFPIEQIEKIINTIGEPFLKSKLLDMYNRKFIYEYKIREQKRIDEQIRILQEKREKL